MNLLSTCHSLGPPGLLRSRRRNPHNGIQILFTHPNRLKCSTKHVHFTDISTLWYVILEWNTRKISSQNSNFSGQRRKQVCPYLLIGLACNPNMIISNNNEKNIIIKLRPIITLNLWSPEDPTYWVGLSGMFLGIIPYQGLVYFSHSLHGWISFFLFFFFCYSFTFTSLIVILQYWSPMTMRV